MAIGYLISPVIQVEDINGMPLVGGRIRVYEHGTTTPYITYKDFNGDMNPAEVILDNKGMCILLADMDGLYDIYCEDRNYVEQWSRLNVSPGQGGGGSSSSITNITSSDNSLVIIRTGSTVDIKLNGNGNPSALSAFSAVRSTDGNFNFVCDPINQVGDDLKVYNEKILGKRKWYHYDATVNIAWVGTPSNSEQEVVISGPDNSEHVFFDLSYPHTESLDISGVYEIQINNGPFTFSIQGMPEGMTAQVVNASIHVLESGTVGGGGDVPANGTVHRLLRYYTNAGDADETHPVGDWLHDLDAVDPDDPSGHPMVTADQLFDWLNAGQTFDLYEVDVQGGIEKWNAVYHQSTWQDQSEWWSQFAPVPGKAVRIEFFRMGMYSTPYRGGLIAYIRYKDEEYMRLYEIKPGNSIWMAEYQEKLPYYSYNWHNGDLLRVKQDGSGLEWVTVHEPVIGTVDL